MMVVGRAGSVGRKTVLLYIITTITASIVGLLSAIAVKGLFSEGAFDERPPASVMLGCNNADMFITESEDGSLSCTAEMGSSSEFILEDVGGAFVKSGSGPNSSYSLSDTVYDGVFMKLVTSNITQSFTSGNFAAVVVFAVVFGMALSSHLFKQGKAVKGSVVLTFLKEMEKTLMQIIYWIIMITPFAVLSLISAQVGKQDDLLDKFANVGYLVLSLLLGLAAHSLIIHFGLWYFITKTNPIDYLKFLIPAQTMAFACSSSAATLPMTQKCVKSSGRVPDSIGRFVLPLGATVNMDGTTIYFTTCCIW
jgi:Na+/H+-dicarboxylate symporter